MSATFFNMRRRIAAQKAKQEQKTDCKNVDKPTEKPKKGKVKNDV